MPAFKLIVVTTIFLTLSDAHGQRLIRTQLDETTICYPAENSPDSSFMDAFLKPIEDQLDSSDSSVRIRIPVQKIKELVPEFTINHINSFGVDVEHDLSGIAWAKSEIGNPNGMAEAAWNRFEKVENALIEPDPDLPLFRLSNYTSWKLGWDLVQYKPPETPVGTPPEGWYIASCHDIYGGVSCRQSSEFKSITYEYRLFIHDMHLRDDIDMAVQMIFEEWERNCQ